MVCPQTRSQTRRNHQTLDHQKIGATSTRTTLNRADHHGNICDMHTAFAQAVEADKPTPAQSNCTIARLLRNGALEQSDLTLMAELWDQGNGDWNLPRITNTLRTATGTNIGISTVGRHLRGGCKCGQA